MTPIKKLKNLEQIYTVIRDRITLLDYMPGEKLSEVVLAEQFGVSRTPIRSILSRLESEGLVAVRHGVGTFVTNIDLASMTEVYQLRKELALMWVRLDTAKPTPELITQLLTALDELRGLENSEMSKRRFARLNQQIFEHLHSIVLNRPFREINTRLFYQTARVWIAWMPSERVKQEAGVFADELQQLVERLQQGDLDTFVHLYRCYLAFGFERLSQYAQSCAPVTAAVV